jgi:hypothetical protein
VVLKDFLAKRINLTFQHVLPAHPFCRKLKAAYAEQIGSEVTYEGAGDTAKLFRHDAEQGEYGYEDESAAKRNECGNYRAA